MKEIIIWAYWPALDFDGSIYLPETHLRYIAYSAGRYTKVHLIIPCREAKEAPKIGLVDFANVFIHTLPHRSGHAGYNADVFRCVILLNQFSRDTALYLRVPDPLRWLPSILGFKNITFHFVGNALEVLSSDTYKGWKWKFRKLLYAIEEKLLLTLIKTNPSARIFANGNPLGEYCSRKGVKSTVVISSTLLDNDRLELSSPPARLRLLHVGYLRRTKNLDVLVGLLLLLSAAQQSVHLDIVGDGDYRNGLEAEFVKAGVGNLVTFHGHVDNRQLLSKLFKCASFFVFPSLSEGSPRVVIEAMALGTVVVATKVGSLPTTFDNGKEIVFVEEGSAKAFFDAICQLKDDSRLVGAIRVDAYEKVWKNYTLSKFLGKVFP